MQAPSLVESTYCCGAFALRLRTRALIQPLERFEVGAVDRHVDGVALDPVVLAALAVQCEHDLLVGIPRLRVLFGVGHAKLRCEPAAVHIALLRQEREHLMVHHRVLRALARSRVVPGDLARLVHLLEPRLAPRDVLHIAHQRALVVDVCPQVLRVDLRRHRALLDDGHCLFLPSHDRAFIPACP